MAQSLAGSITRFSSRECCISGLIAAVVAFAMTALPFLLTGANPLTDVLTAGDGLLCFLPYMELLRLHVLNGELPLWNPYYYGGFPFAADPQAAVWFPPNLLLALLPSVPGFNVRVALAMAVALWGMFMLLRQLGTGRAAAIAGAICFGLGGSLMVRVAVQPTMVACAGLLPWLILTQHLSTTKIRCAGYGALVAGLILLAGHPQVALYCLATLGLLELMRAMGIAARARRMGQQAGRAFLLALIPVLLVGTIGALLASIQILPTKELTATSGRPEITRDFFFSYAMKPSGFLLGVYPYFFGDYKWITWTKESYIGPENMNELAFYAGLFPLALSIVVFAITFVPKLNRGGNSRLRIDKLPRGLRRLLLRTRPWMILLVLAFLMALGDATPLGSLFYNIPPFNLFRVPGRYLIIVQFAMAVVTALALDECMRSRSGERWPLKLLLAGALLSLAMLLLSPVFWRLLFDGETAALLFERLGLHHRIDSVWEFAWQHRGIWISALIGLCGIGWLLAMVARGWIGKLSVSWVMVLPWLVIDIVIHSTFLLPRPEPIQQRLTAESTDDFLAGAGRLLVGVPYDQLWGEEYKYLAPGMNIMKQVESLGGHAPLAPGRLQQRLGISVIGSVEPPEAMLNGGGERLAALGVDRIVLPVSTSRRLMEAAMKQGRLRLRGEKQAIELLDSDAWIFKEFTEHHRENENSYIRLKSPNRVDLAFCTHPLNPSAEDRFVNITVKLRREDVPTSMPLHIDLYGTNYDSDSQESWIEDTELSSVTTKHQFLIPIGNLPDDLQLRLFTRSTAGIVIEALDIRFAESVDLGNAVASIGTVNEEMMRWEIAGWNPVRIATASEEVIDARLVGKTVSKNQRTQLLEIEAPFPANAGLLHIFPGIRYEKGWGAWLLDDRGRKIHKLRVQRGEHMELRLVADEDEEPAIAAALQAGTLKISLSYMPRAFIIGALLSMLGALAVMIMVLGRKIPLD